VVNYRELHKAKDEHGPKAAEIRIGEESTEQGQQKYGADEVRHYVRRFRQRKVHLVEYIRYQIIPHSCYCHNLKCLYALYVSNCQQKPILGKLKKINEAEKYSAEKTLQ
jgi:hypothetical protein